MSMPALLMEQLFKPDRSGSALPLNMNVLDARSDAAVMNLKEVLQAFLDHRLEVLVRRSRHRLGQDRAPSGSAGRLLIAYLNLDEVIPIIRTEDEPKPVLMRRFELTDIQAEAILNMRLRSLRKLEEMEIKAEHASSARGARRHLNSCSAPTKKQWKRSSARSADIKKRFGPKTPLGKRRTDFAGARRRMDGRIEEALIENEAITVILSEKGWICALQGPCDDPSELTFKKGDSAELR